MPDQGADGALRLDDRPAPVTPHSARKANLFPAVDLREGLRRSGARFQPQHRRSREVTHLLLLPPAPKQHQTAYLEPCTMFRSLRRLPWLRGS